MSMSAAAMTPMSPASMAHEVCHLVKGGTRSNREECHSMTHELIAEPFPSRAGEVRTEGVGISKAALARESRRVPAEEGGKTCPEEEYSRELQSSLISQLDIIWQTLSDATIGQGRCLNRQHLFSYVCTRCRCISCDWLQL